MCSCVTLVLVALAMSVTAVYFDPDDESDYVDNREDPPDHARAADVNPQRTWTEKNVHGEIERLLRQSVLHYEDPACSPHPPATPVLSTDFSQPVSNMEIYVAPIAGHRGSPERVASGSRSSEGLNLRTFRTARPKQQRTREVVYSVHVPSGGQPVVRNKRPGVIESLVGAHDVTRRESTRERRTYAGARAYNEGGTRPRGATGRRHAAGAVLVEIPESLKKTQTRPPRPTPTTQSLETTYKYTRRTKKHPNCTDDYYQCLAMCFDRKGYRVRCKHETTVRPPPARINMSGLIAAAIEIPLNDYDTKNLVKQFKNWLLDRGYRTCMEYTTTTRTYPPILPIYYDDAVNKKTGTIIAKCWVCGLLDQGIPRNSNCADNFGAMGNAVAIAEKNSYRRYCRYMDEVPLWFNRSDPFSVWGQWTGGCSYRWLDLSGLYTQRTCRSTTYPATGHHYLSRRMANLELSLKDVKTGCMVSPMATLVPFSRAVSLFARFHVCVCRGSFCNRATRGRALASPVVVALLAITLREL